MPAWLTLKLAWKLTPWLLVIGAGIAAYIFYLRADAADVRADQAELALQQAVQVNKENVVELEKMHRQAESDARLVANNIAETRRHTMKIDQVKKIVKDADDANELLNTNDIDFFNRLRETRNNNAD